MEPTQPKDVPELPVEAVQAPQADATPPPPPSPGEQAGGSQGSSGPEDGGWRAGAHLIVLVGLVPFIPLNVAGLLGALLYGHFVEPRHPGVRAHAREVFNFQINVAIVLAFAQLLIFSFVGCCLGLPMCITAWLANVILVFIGAWYAGDGVHYRYPCFWRPLDSDG